MCTAYRAERDVMKKSVLMTLVALTASAKTASPGIGPAQTSALWVYSISSLPNAVTDAPTRDTLIQDASASGVNMLYPSVYSSTPNSAGRNLFDEGLIASFISAAHGQGMQVYAAIGDPDWPSLGCAASANPSKRVADIIGYTSANPTAKFDGIILDVEPGSNPDFQGLLTLYQCLQQQANAGGLGLSAAINAFWNTVVTFNQVTEEAYKQIVDLNLNNIVVMGYRNTAGTMDCSQGDGLICLDENVIAYANSVSRANSILVGLDTDNPATSGSTAEETFFSMGQTAMNEASQSVSNQLAAANQTFGGFAINNYRDSYLNGQLAGWPATNPPPAVPIPQFTAAAVVNSASALAGSIAPGELVSIFGQNLGPGSAQVLQVANGDVTTTLGGVRVLFNGVAAPMVLAYSGQLNAIVPFEVSGSSTATIQVEYSGAASSSVTAPVAAAAPGIFTADSSGKGQAAALNQDYSYNNSANPAAPGSVVILYMTGAGQTAPAGVDGLVPSDPNALGLPVLPVTAQIGNLPATVAYAGNSLGIVSGVLQVNLVLPSGLRAGQQTVTLQIGSSQTQPGVTVAVQ
jgi:uncharacterized protein (TIGR03437 family)